MSHINEKLLELIETHKIKIKTITKDNGSEFNLLTKVTKDLDIKVYTCNPTLHAKEEQMKTLMVL